MWHNGLRGDLRDTGVFGSWVSVPEKDCKRHIAEIAWKTEVWLSEIPDHLIHFNGELRGRETVTESLRKKLKISERYGLQKAPAFPGPFPVTGSAPTLLRQTLLYTGPLLTRLT